MGAVQLEAADGGIFVAIVGPVFFLVQFGEGHLVLRQFVLGGEGFGRGFREVLRLDRGEREGLHSFRALLVGCLG